MSNIKEQIRQEIERQRNFIEGLFIEGDNSFYDGQDDAYNHLLAFIDSLPEEKPSENLEEAAEEYALLFNDGTKWKDGGKYKGFIAGAEWQKEQDVRDMYMSDNRNFLKCYEQGKKDMKQQMMKDAVEGFVAIHLTSEGTKVTVNSGYLPKEMCIKPGDKVRIIIVKED